MSWQRRDENRYNNRWESDDRNENTRSRSPIVVWEPRASPGRRHESPPRDRYRERHDRDRKERFDREQERYTRTRDRYDRSRDRDRDRDRRRSPQRRYDDREDLPSAPSPPRISEDYPRSREDTRPSHRDHSSSRDQRQGSNEPHDSRPFDSKASYESRLEPKDKTEMDSQNQANSASPGDWYCKCGSYNFKRRHICYRRNCNGKRSEGVIYGGDVSTESNSGITKRLLFRRLDALTTEEKILDAIKEVCSKEVIDSIAGITIGRETLTGASKCLAYINFNSIADSTAAHTELTSLKSPLVIDNREVLISYYNEMAKPQKSVNPVDYATYYAQAAAYATNSQAMSEADRVNAAAAVAQSAISAAHARNSSWTPVAAPTFVSTTAPATTPVNTPTGDGKTTYPAPDTRTFLYDETSGYYYDPSTGLYYDGTTQYFFNNQLNQYMYWDATTSTYVAATQTQQNTDQPKLPSPPEVTVENTISTKDPPEEKKKRDKEDKVKVAKKIAKDMERWARTLNQRKENARSNIVMEQPLDTGASVGSADIGFSVLGAGPALSHSVKEREPSPPPNTEEFLMKKVADQPVFECDEGIIDWSKLTCLLCKRRFPSVEVLNKHKTLSDLHKQNLAEYRKKSDSLPQPNGYRDRAAERRLKFGEDEAPIRKRYEPPQPTASQMPIHPPPSVVDTIGGKMLQKMGWSQGRGLGKEEQGRTAPIEAEQRPSLAGLGQKRGIYTPTPGETYRDTVKKLMIARYKEVVGQEDEDK